MDKGIKLIVGIVLTVSIIIVGVRIWKVNTEDEKIKQETYEMGETVDLSGCYLFQEDENVEGYSVTVIDSQLMTRQEFMESHGTINDDFNLKNDELVVNVKLLIQNSNKQDTGQTGLFIGGYKLTDRACFINLDSTLLTIANPTLPSEMFLAIRPDSEMVVELPFSFSQNTKINPISKDRVEKGNFILTVAFSPVQKNLKVNIR
ncbi:MAG: DUF5028 domain-containing protein [Lachnospiraceae bacterium]|nr:DUF5028 domain-containing protein [Lachnospiraceae bacterium]